MANSGSNIPEGADILSQLGNNDNSQNNSQNSMPFDSFSTPKDYTPILTSIDKNVQDLLKNSFNASQSNFRNSAPTGNARQQKGGKTSSPLDNLFGKSKKKSSFLDGLERSLMDGLLGSNFKDEIDGMLKHFAKDMGVDISDLPGTLGKTLGDTALNAFKGTGLGKQLTGALSGMKDKVLGDIKSRYNKGFDKSMRQQGQDPDKWRAKQAADEAKAKEAQQAAQNKAAADAQAAEKSAKEQAAKEQADILSSALKEAFSSEDFNIQEMSVSAANVVINQQSEPNSQDIPKDPAEEAQTEAKNMLEKADDAKDLIEKADDAKNMAEKADDAGKMLDKVDDAGNLVDDVANVATKSAASPVDDIALAAANPADDIALAATTSGGSAAAAGGATAAGGAAAGGATAAGGAAAGGSAALSGALAAAGPYILVAVAALAALAVAAYALGPAFEGLKELAGAVGNAANRQAKSREKNLEAAQKRLEADLEVLVKTPFDILKDAAETLYNTWDNQMRMINATQGYNKEELQHLMSNFGQRLRDEGLSRYVSGADLTDNLSKVLESGLSGKVAEEFAYIATKLNAAVPTQDFFAYGESYAAIAANMIKSGKSEDEAIAYANKQLNSFANNVLYASRELSGGFSTGLKDAQSLFDQSVKIATASRSGEVSNISGVLTAVSAVTGAIAPDLAQTMTDAIYNAAVGGNSSEIIALRSLAGINASNTEFLKQLAQDPQSVFTNLFAALAEKQNMSEAAYMEVAEGLSNIFGVSMDAFARVDFGYLAQAISSMNINSNALDKNLNLLTAGETTTTTEQMKMQQINQYMIDEGLAYVLDSEAARSIQEHMWDEQIAREMQEATYGIEIQGAALSFLSGISQTIENIMNILNPIGFLKKSIDNMVTSVMEGNALEADLKAVLEEGKVGPGNRSLLHALTTRNQNLNLTDPLVKLINPNAISAYELASNLTKLNQVSHYAHSGGILGGLIGAAEQFGAIQLSGAASSPAKSSYTWGVVGKSIARAIAATPLSVKGAASSTQAQELSAMSASEKAQNETNAKVNEAVNSMADYFKNVKDLEGGFRNEDVTFENWWEGAKKSSTGLDWRNNEDTLLENAGLSKDDLKAKFDEYMNQQAAERNLAREDREDKFWDKTEELLGKILESFNNWAGNYSDNTWAYVSSEALTWKGWWAKWNGRPDGVTHTWEDMTISMAQWKTNWDAWKLGWDYWAGIEYTKNKGETVINESDTETTFVSLHNLISEWKGSWDTWIGDKGGWGKFHKEWLYWSGVTYKDDKFDDITSTTFSKMYEMMENWANYFTNKIYYHGLSGNLNADGTIKDPMVKPTSLLDAWNAVNAGTRDQNTKAVYRLADVLTSFSNLNQLKDPALQTNVLLGQILKVATLIAQQGADGRYAEMSDNLVEKVLGGYLKS